MFPKEVTVNYYANESAYRTGTIAFSETYPDRNTALFAARSKKNVFPYFDIVG